jgi:hypothetical protein
MKKLKLIMAICLGAIAITATCLRTIEAQTSSKQNPALFTLAPSKVDFDAYEKLMKEVKEYRKGRLVNLETFLASSKEKNVIILDTRSEAMFKAKHVKGAINLNFSDFTQANLAKIIPSTDAKILIYCNNNFGEDERFFATKSYVPPVKSEKELTLALNIPTFINLYGYGYKNVYELSELVSVFDKRIAFEGTAVDVSGF